MAKIPVSVLRIRCPLVDTSRECEWALIDGIDNVVSGEGPVAELPRRATRVELVIPAADVLITRTQLPPTARRRAGSLLAFAVEDETLGEPEAHRVSWLGTSGGADVVAVVDKVQLMQRLDALAEAGIGAYEVHCETLLLPLTDGEWSLAWDGYEGFVRTGGIEGAATDAGDRYQPPLSLRLMIEDAAARGAQPACIALYVTAPDAAPDLQVWQQELGVALRLAGSWDWRTAPSQAVARLAQEHARSRVLSRVGGRLRSAAWIAGAALAIHAIALVADWTWLAAEQRTLRRQMESRFRAVFPDAVAVVDPMLQMRRKLGDARHAVGQPDSADFLPMISQVAEAVKELPSRSVRVASYETGRLTLQIDGAEDAAVRRIAARLVQAGLRVDISPPAARSANAGVVLTVGGA